MIKFFKLLIVVIFITGCNSESKKMKEKKYTNSLINETSPYLLQHAHNPVQWYPWNKETLKKAKDEGKLLLISIGYSACHWCHVMEHESFQDENIAEYMNKNFINIKVDREERPDIDQIYINAVQLMTQSAGWPLNCIALPDGRPIWGGTYFPKDTWLKQIQAVNKFYIESPNDVINYADNLSRGIQESELIKLNEKPINLTWEDLDKMVSIWSQNFDTINGNTKKSPKFPLPNNYQFLMRYGHFKNDQEIIEHVKLTLNKMAYGGIYDQIGGGFSRYSVDAYWKVPHFEKMLYDNAQLVSLYSEAYIAFKTPLYKTIIKETLDFVERELMSEKGVFYSALDADSEGEEGKFYTWKKEDLKDILKNDYDLFKDYYNINELGEWENENYILLKNKSDSDFCKEKKINQTEFKEKNKKWKNLLLNKRKNRIRPGLDDKSLTSWNALMCEAFVDGYMALGETKYLDIAIKNGEFLINKQLKKDGRLNHSYKNNISSINGYLEDYAFTISAFIRLYEATFNVEWLNEAKKLTDYTIKHFQNKTSKMFYFTSDLDDALIARKMETRDNVIPASNSEMANNLFLLSQYLDDKLYFEYSDIMLNNIKDIIYEYGSSYSNWGILYLNRIVPFYQIAILGLNSNKLSWEINQKYNPNKLFVGSKNKNVNLPILEYKWIDEATTTYVCKNKVCQMPIILDDNQYSKKELKSKKFDEILELIK